MSIEDDIRRSLHRHAEDASVSPEAWDAVRQRIAGGGSPITVHPDPRSGPGRRRALAMAAAVVVVAAVTASAALWSIDESQNVRTVPGGVTTSPPEATVSVPSTPAAADSTTAPAPASVSSTTSGSSTTAPPPSTTTSRPTTSSTTSPESRTPPPAPPTSWKVTMAGIGPVQAGMTLAAASAATGLTFTADPDSFIDVPGQGCGYATAVGGPADVRFMVDGDRIVRVDVDNPSVTTVSGMGIGSTEAEVRATYPGIVSEPHTYVEGGHQLVFQATGDTTHLLLFETDGSTVTRFRSGFQAVRAPEGCA